MAPLGGRMRRTGFRDRPQGLLPARPRPVSWGRPRDSSRSPAGTTAAARWLLREAARRCATVT